MLDNVARVYNLKTIMISLWRNRKFGPASNNVLFVLHSQTTQIMNFYFCGEYFINWADWLHGLVVGTFNSSVGFVSIVGFYLHCQWRVVGVVDRLHFMSYVMPWNKLCDKMMCHLL